jgi:hypothetical protein
MHLANCPNLMSPTDSFDEAKVFANVAVCRRFTDAIPVLSIQRLHPSTLPALYTMGGERLPTAQKRNAVIEEEWALLAKLTKPAVAGAEALERGPVNIVNSQPAGLRR